MATIPEALAIAVQHHQAGRLHEAEVIYRRILAADPNHADTLHLLGVIAHQMGQHESAVEYIERAIALNGAEPAYHNNLGTVLQTQKKPEAASDSFRRALQLKPDYAEARFNLGNALNDQGKRDEAVDCYREAVALRPDYVDAHNNLGGILLSQGNPQEAESSFRRVLELKPNFIAAWYNLGNALRDQKRLNEAVVCYRKTLEMEPNYAEAHNSLGIALATSGKPAEATVAFRRAAELDPASAIAFSNLGNTLKSQRKLDEAIDCYRHAVKLDPNHAEAHSNLVLALQYRSDITLAELATAHAEYDRLHAAPLRDAWRRHENDRIQDRRLRLGFVSPDFVRHPVTFFLIRVVENLDPAQCELAGYNDRNDRDEVTDRVRAAMSIWRDVRGLSNQDLVQRIRDDRIDILFDLTGHTARNRLLVFAHKPAPIQVTWAGYVGTTGLTAMDYVLADRYEIPEGADVHYSERVLRMPDGYVTYDPPRYAPDVSPLPAPNQGYVTFGCFNNPTKFNARTFTLWSQILHRVPRSRIVFKYAGLNDPAIARGLTDAFVSHGIDPQRIECLGSSPHPALLAAYHRIDLALDTFPYSGGLTTCEALWMGVPVVTCPGETFASRHSLSHLSNVGLTETIASTPDEYIDRAVSLANDLPRLAALRSNLRQQMAASPLCDGKRFAANLMTLLRNAWKEWVSQGHP
jgi:predicted O-linked N-acetylglucosamine transferase (SPINDLY family)